MNKRSKNRKDTNSPANRGQNVRTPRSIQSGGRSDFESRSSDEDDDIREKSNVKLINQKKNSFNVSVALSKDEKIDNIKRIKQEMQLLDIKKKRYKKKLEEITIQAET